MTMVVAESTMTIIKEVAITREEAIAAMMEKEAEVREITIEVVAIGKTITRIDKGRTETDFKDKIETGPIDKTRIGHRDRRGRSRIPTPTSGSITRMIPFSTRMSYGRKNLPSSSKYICSLTRARMKMVNIAKIVIRTEN